MRFRRCLFILLFSLVPNLRAQSQMASRYEIFGGYSYLSNSFNGIAGNRQPLNGWDASAAFAPWHNLRFKIDVAGYVGTNIGAPQHAVIFLAGAQYTWHIRREALFVEGLMGDAGLNQDWGPNKLPGMSASFAALAGGGFDTPLTHRLALRMDGGYFYSNFALIQSPSYTYPYRIPGLPNNFGRLAAGPVWRF